MKPKTLKLTVFLLIFAGAFTACEKIDLLNIDTTAIYATAEGGTFTISVSSNGAWTAVVQDAENNSWITLNNASGTNNGVVTVNIEKNPLSEIRSTTIKVSMGSLSEIVLVEQEEPEISPNNELIASNLLEKGSADLELLVGDWEPIKFARTVDGNRISKVSIISDVSLPNRRTIRIRNYDPALFIANAPQGLFGPWSFLNHFHFYSISGNLISFSRFSDSAFGIYIRPTEVGYRILDALVNTFSFVVIDDELVVHFTGQADKNLLILRKLQGL